MPSRSFMEQHDETHTCVVSISLFSVCGGSLHGDLLGPDTVTQLRSHNDEMGTHQCKVEGQ